MLNIWVIDDESELCQDVIAYWKRISAGYPFAFRHFSTAARALATLRRLMARSQGVPSNQDVPWAIIADGHLKRDEGELREGAKVVREIIGMWGKGSESNGSESNERDHKGMEHLVAWSADYLALEEMRVSGAEMGFGKVKPKDVILYLQRQYDKASTITEDDEAKFQ